MPATKEFFARYNFEIVAAGSRAERVEIESRLKAEPVIADAFTHYWDHFEAEKRALEPLYRWQKAITVDEDSGAQPDSYRYFAERGVQLVGPHGWLGWVIPSAFHANEGATGVRRLYLERLSLRTCFSFENRRKLFEIHSSFKFALVIAKAGESSTSVSVAFYLHDDDWLFGERLFPNELIYSTSFIARVGGKYFAFPELRTRIDLDVLNTCVEHAGEDIEHFLARLGVSCGEELNKTRQSRRFRRPPREVASRWNSLSEWLPEHGLFVYEGTQIWHFDDRFGAPPDYFLPYSELVERADIAALCRHFRFGYRLIASSTNERTLVAAILPPAIACTQSISVERAVKAARADALFLLVFWNSFTVDWLARQRIAATVNKFLLETIPVPVLQESRRFLAHIGLRLSSNHDAYSDLWRQQLNDIWRESSPKFTWPALEDDAERWQVRAAADAVVAEAFGLAQEQYEHVLSTFSHTSYAQAPELCLRMFNEVKSIGLQAFTTKYDPYWDIPLNDNPPQPSIDFPVPLAAAGVGSGQMALPREDAVIAAAEADNPATQKPKARRQRRRLP
jgi:hypothetical protein